MDREQTAEAGKRQGAKSQPFAWTLRKLGQKILVCEGNRKRLSPGPEEKLQAAFPKVEDLLWDILWKKFFEVKFLWDTQ